MDIQQKPAYSFKIKKSKLLIPKINSLILLTSIFYFGILLNISLLKLKADTETSIKSASLMIAVLLILIGIMHNFKISKRSYNFYSDRIVWGKKEIKYSEIDEIKEHKSISDKLFSTHSLKLSQKFNIEHIPNSVNLKNYIQQMINYNKTLQPRQAY